MSSRALRRRAAYRAVNGHAKQKSHPFLKLLVVALVGVTMISSGASAATIFFYGQNLPSLKGFKARFQFQNTIIRDFYGHQLYDMADVQHKGHGKRVVEPLVDPSHPTRYYVSNHEPWLVGADTGRGIPVSLQDATIATEDASFYSNLGFDPLSIIRAGVDNFTTGHVVSGASTITQQLVKEYMLNSTPSISRKAEEIVLATEVTQKYSKQQILWYYLNSVPYGNLSYGAQAAAKSYFGKSVWKLDPYQCAFLAGLPEAPSLYNPVNNLPAAKARMQHVLHLEYTHGYLSDPQKVGEQALISSIMNSKEVKSWHFKPPTTLKRDPHFVQYAIDQLTKLGTTVPALKDRIYDGLDVVTTLDPRLQADAQSIVQKQISSLGVTNHITDGALVSIDVRKSCYGCIRAWIGSADYNNVAIHGQIDMADSYRQPGSSFKPFNYLYAFEHGLAPGTTVLDAPLAIPDPGNPGDNGMYQPENYDHTWHGVVTLRTALQNSLNIPAVKVEQFNAQQSPDGLLAIKNTAIKMGLTSFDADNPHCCGWSLTLGGLEHGTRLVEETAAYGAFASNGWTVPPIAIWKVYDRNTHQLLYDAQRDGPRPQQVIPHPEDAYLINNVLSDNASRCAVICEFGLDSPLNLGRTAAAKTGTTNGFTDNWTVGYTPDIVTGVWVGNADNTPMTDNTTGIMGAAPIWHDFMIDAFRILKLPPKEFWQPPNVMSGTQCRTPGEYESYSTMSYDIFAGIIPFCTVGTYTASATVPQAQTPYQPPAVNQQPIVQQPVVPVAPAAPLPTAIPPAPVATAIPQPAPIQQSPTQAPVIQQPTAVQPVSTPASQAPIPPPPSSGIRPP